MLLLIAVLAIADAVDPELVRNLKKEYYQWPDDLDPDDIDADDAGKRVKLHAASPAESVAAALPPASPVAHFGNVAAEIARLIYVEACEPDTRVPCAVGWTVDSETQLCMPPAEQYEGLCQFMPQFSPPLAWASCWAGLPCKTDQTPPSTEPCPAPYHEIHKDDSHHWCLQTRLGVCSPLLKVPIGQDDLERAKTLARCGLNEKVRTGMAPRASTATPGEPAARRRRRDQLDQLVYNGPLTSPATADRDAD